MNKKELRQHLRHMGKFTEECVLGNRVIMKTTSGYAIRSVNDEDDPMTDYSAYVYGFKENEILNMAKERAWITND